MNKNLERRVEKLEKRLKWYLRQNSKLLAKLSRIVENQRHYLRFRVSKDNPRNVWRKRVLELAHLAKRMKREQKILSRDQVDKNGEVKCQLWVTPNQRLKIMHWLEK